MPDIPQEYVLYAILGSLLPTFFWLWFWSRRDRFCPEPRIHIFGAFIFGALAAMFAVPTQLLVAALLGSFPVVAMVLFATVEEYIKYLCCWYNAMRTNPYYNERIDPVVYLVTTALGFAFLENILYFLQFLNEFDLHTATLEGGKRIMGATILHMVTAATVGLFLSLVFFTTSRVVKAAALLVGLVAAVVVHVGFNHLVSQSNQDMMLVAFGITWFLLILILVLIEILRSPTCPPEIDWNKYDL